MSGRPARYGMSPPGWSRPAWRRSSARPTWGGSSLTTRVDIPTGRLSTAIDNGLRTREIQDGVDRPIGAAERLSNYFAGVDFGIAPGLPAIERGGTRPGTDPIKLGTSNILTFSALGTSSSGSLYVRGRTWCAIRHSGSRGNRPGAHTEVRRPHADMEARMTTSDRRDAPRCAPPEEIRSCRRAHSTRVRRRGRRHVERRRPGGKPSSADAWGDGRAAFAADKQPATVVRGQGRAMPRGSPGRKHGPLPRGNCIRTLSLDVLKSRAQWVCGSRAINRGIRRP